MSRRSASRRSRRRHAARRPGRQRRRGTLMLVGAALVLAAALTTLAVVSSRGGAESDDAAVEVVLPEGPARAVDVVVAEPVADLGHVPLNFAVQHVFHLVNTGVEPASLGRPSVITLDGC